MHLPSGGDLYADVTTGYGPECFTIRDPHALNAYPYTLQAHYYSRGPMGYGMGKLEVLEHDGKGNLTFSERPFVVMIDHAYVDMGTVDKSTEAHSDQRHSEPRRRRHALASKACRRLVPVAFVLASAAACGNLITLAPSTSEDAGSDGAPCLRDGATPAIRN